MNRITDKQLQSLCDYINELTGSPLTPYTRDEQGFRANIGNYHLSHAYGGVCLHRMVNEGGGIRTILTSGHVTKRELYNAMQAYIRGLDDVRFKDIQLKTVEA
jgi:hypothetical protein